MPFAPKPHKPASRSHHRPPRRNTRGQQQVRNYQCGWDKEDGLRAWYLAQHPTCEDCLADGFVVGRGTTQRKEVDHIIPFFGISDPLRLDQVNLRTRCRSHHAEKTSRHDAAIRMMFDALRRAEASYEEARDATLATWREAMVAK